MTSFVKGLVFFFFRCNLKSEAFVLNMRLKLCVTGGKNEKTKRKILGIVPGGDVANYRNAFMGICNRNGGCVSVYYFCRKGYILQWKCNELTEQSSQPMIYVGSKLLENYFWEETKVEIFSRMDSNLNLAGNTYSKTYVSVGGNVNLNGVAIGAENNIEIGTQKVGQSYNVNANRAVLYSAKGDIIIDVDNFNFNGLIYAPNGNVEISSDGNIGVQGVIIAQHVTLQGGNLNLQSDTTTARFVADMMEKSDNSENIPNKDNTEDGSEETSEDTSEDVSEDTTEDSPKDPIEDDSEETTEDNSQEPTEEPSEEVPETEYADADGDGLIDEIEEEIGTNPNKADSDGDNLSDFDEIYLTGTNPIKTDTDDDGISDDKEDADEDKLNTLEEIRAGTLPTYADTDCDGLLDGEEGSYATDPLDIDTDDDGLWDGDEIAIGLNPCNPATFGIPDAEYTMLQTIDADSAVLSDVNVTENAYDLQIDAKVSGNLQAHLIAEETGYRAVIANDSMVGMPIELTYDENCQVEEVTLSFAVKEAYRANEISYFSDANDTENYSPELVGIKRLQVFKYFEEDNMLLPIETFHDEETNTVKTVVDEFGVYCLIDMEKWILSLAEQGGVMEQPAVMSLDDNSESIIYSPEEAQGGVEESFTNEDSEVILENYNIQTDTLSDEVLVESLNQQEDIVEQAENVTVIQSTVSRSAEKINESVDIVFILQLWGNRRSDFNIQKEAIDNIATQVFATYSDARISVVTFDIDTASAVNNGDDIWFTDAVALGNALDNIEYVGYSNYCDRGYAYEFIKDEMQLRDYASKFIYCMLNGKSYATHSYYTQIKLMEDVNAIYSEITFEGFEYDSESFTNSLATKIKENNGLQLHTIDDIDSRIWEHIKLHVGVEKAEYKAITANGWSTITLDAPLKANNGVDTDDDTLLDWDEVDVDNELITWNADGSVELPVIYDCITSGDVKYVESGLDRILGAEGIPTNVAGKVLAMMLYTYKVMPINSDPTSIDSDEDGLEDYRDSKPLHYDGIPSEFLKYIHLGYIDITDLRRADDGFTICIKPLDEIMNEMGIAADGYDDNTYYFNDWFLYGYKNDNGVYVYSLIKMRTKENVSQKEPGVSIPFREFNINLLLEGDSEKLGKELEKITEMDTFVMHDVNIAFYFMKMNNKTNYFLAELYLEMIIKNDNINGNGTFEIPQNIAPRVLERLEESSDVYCQDTNIITIKDINNLSLDEQQCLLVSRAGTISYNAFSAEIIAHAMGAYFNGGKTVIGVFGIPIYNSAKKADLGASDFDDYSKGESIYAREDAPLVIIQRRLFGDY